MGAVRHMKAGVMGFVNVEVGGSFDLAEHGVHQFGAMESGHAAAIGEAMAYLASLLPDAIRRDHQLQYEGAMPRDGFRISR